MAGWKRDLSGRSGCMCSKGAVVIGKKKERRKEGELIVGVSKVC